MRRVIESSDEDSDNDDDENERAGEKSNKRVSAASGVTSKNTASEEVRKDDTNEPSSTKQAGTSRAVGQGKQKPKEATRRSTRLRRGVTKMGGVMINLVDHKWEEASKAEPR